MVTLSRALLVLVLAAGLSRGAVPPEQPAFEKNHPVEDFFTVSLVSIPFTAFWAMIGASVVGGISQGKFPPEYSDQMLIGAGSVALGASFSVGLVSAFWGKGKTPSTSISKP